MRPGHSSKEGVIRLQVVIGADHGGFTLKKELVARLKGTYDILDLGANTLDLADDYPDISKAVASRVASGRAERGIII